MFTSQGDAKSFFVDKILEQAALEGTPLSTAQQWMLRFSESDPEFTVDPAMVDALADEMTDDDYEAVIAGLIQRAYARDVAQASSSRERYQSARAMIEQGDHYLLVMIDRALPGKPW